MKIRTIYALLLSLIFKFSVAQDPIFSQYQSNTLYLNPAFAGAFTNPTFTASYRDQWPALSAGDKTGIFEYQQYVDALHGGIGGYVIYDDEFGSYITEIAKLIYSYRIEIGNTVVIQPGFGAGYTNQNATWYEPLYNPSTGFFYGSEIKQQNSKGFFDCNAGLLLYSKYLYGGFAIDHLTQPNASVFSSIPSDLPSKYTIHAGANIPIADSTSSIYISPDIIYISEEDFYSFLTGLTVKVKYVLAGITYRISQQNDGYLIFSAGFQNKILRIGYSYERATGFFSNTNDYTHEVFLSYTLNTRKQQSRLALQMIGF